MHLEQLPSGSWRVTVSHNGTRRRAVARTRGQAELLGAQLRLNLEETLGPAIRRPVDIAELNVAELVAMHRAQAGHSATYNAEVQRTIDRLPSTMSNAKVVNITAMQVASWWIYLARHGWTPHAVRRAHEVISAAMTTATRWGVIRVNPCHAARPPRPPAHEIDPPSTQALAKVVTAADQSRPFGAFVFLAVDTGARRGELVGLQWGDIDLDARTVTIRRAVAYTPASGVVVKDTKSGSKGRRTVPLGPVTIDAITRWRAICGGKALDSIRPHAYVFSPDLGMTPRRPDWATQRWGRLCDELGIEGVRLHDVRHALATNLLASGVDPVRVSRRLGHSKTSTTLDIYGHLQVVD